MGAPLGLDLTLPPKKGSRIESYGEFKYLLIAGETMKTIAMLLAVGLLAAGVVYATYATGDPEALAEVSDQAQGALIGIAKEGKSVTILAQETERTYPLASNAWVYKDNRKAGLADLRPGDRVELILNSKQQAAYIKATGRESLPPSADADSEALAGSVDGDKPSSDAQSPPSDTQSPANGAQSPASGVQSSASGAQSPSGGTQSSASGARSPASGAQPPKAAEPSTGPALPAAPKPGGGNTEPVDASDEPAHRGEWPWTEFSLEVKSSELQLKARHKPGKGGNISEADIYVQMKDRTVIHLKDEEAEQWLQLLLQDQPIEAGAGKAWEEALKRQIVANLQLEDASPDVKLKVKRNGGNSRNSGKNNGKGSENSKSSDKHRGDDQDDDREDEDD